MHGQNDTCEIEVGNADKIIIEKILDIDFITRRGGKFRIFYRRDNGKLHIIDYGKIDMNYAEKEDSDENTEATKIAKYYLEDLDKKYKEQVHPKYENVGFTVSEVKGGYKIKWENNAKKDLDYWKHEILMDSSYPIDPDSFDFMKINVHNPDNNYWVIKTERLLKAVQVRAVYY